MGRRGGEGSEKATEEGLRQPQAVAPRAGKGAAPRLPPDPGGMLAPQLRFRLSSPLRGYLARRET